MRNSHSSSDTYCARLSSPHTRHQRRVSPHQSCPSGSSGCTTLTTNTKSRQTDKTTKGRYFTKPYEVLHGCAGGVPGGGWRVFHHGINVFVVCCWNLMFGSLRLPLLLLHVLQMICPLSRVLSPPRLTGVMWSASGLVGKSCVPQVMVVPQSGHSVWPCCRAWVMSLARQRRCAEDAVRLVCAITSPDLPLPL